MSKSTARGPRGRHPDLWRAEASRWVYAAFDSPYAKLLAYKHEREPGIEQAEVVEAAEVPDRTAAIALAHPYLDRHAAEAAGRTGLEVHVRPPEAELRDEGVYEVPAEIVAEARRLGLKGNVAAQIRRMVLDATLSIDGRANLQAGRYLLRVERDRVTWIAEADLARRRRRGGRST